MLGFDRKQQNYLKQLYFNKKLILKNGVKLFGTWEPRSRTCTYKKNLESSMLKGNGWVKVKKAILWISSVRTNT